MYFSIPDDSFIHNKAKLILVKTPYLLFKTYKETFPGIFILKRFKKRSEKKLIQGFILWTLKK